MLKWPISGVIKGTEEGRSTDGKPSLYQQCFGLNLLNKFTYAKEATKGLTLGRAQPATR